MTRPAKREASFQRLTAVLGALQAALARTPQVSRYAVTSTCALGVDIAVYLLLLDARIPLVPAAVAGYAIGMVLHFVLSARFVFDRGAVEKTEARLFSEFVLSGVAGLALTAVIVGFASEVLLLGPLMAKAAAVGGSFLTVYVVRRTVIFAPRSP